jgi:hypothetical protein
MRACWPDKFRLAYPRNKTNPQRYQFSEEPQIYLRCSTLDLSDIAVGNVGVPTCLYHYRSHCHRSNKIQILLDIDEFFFKKTLILFYFLEKKRGRLKGDTAVKVDVFLV